MKKLLPFLIAFLFSLNSKAQSPILTITNVTGSNSITCSQYYLHYVATVSNYTNGPLTYSWVCPSATASGTNVFLTTGGVYTVTAFNTANSFSLSQVFTIGINTVIPTSTVTPMVQNINCPVGSMATFTGITTSTMTNVSHSWQTPYSPGSAINGGTVSIFNLAAVGVHTYCVTDLINGCSTCKTVTVTSTSGFPTCLIASPTQFSLGCSFLSSSSIGIYSVTTFPVAGGPISYTVLPPTYVGPGYGLGGATSYTSNIPGTYTVIVHDNTNNCETIIPVSVTQNTVPQNFEIIAETKTLSCSTPSILLSGISTSSNLGYSWVASTFSTPVTSSSIPVSTTSLTTNTVIATYTVTKVSSTNYCLSSKTVTIYQNTAPPTAFITGPNLISCVTPSLLLTNSSTGNIQAFPHPLPIIASAWYGPVPQASASNVSSYTAYTPGIYTLVVVDPNNGCSSFATKNINDSRVFPIVGSPAPFNINCPINTATIFATVSGTTTGFTYSWTAPATASASSYSQPTITVNTPGTYTLIVTNPVNSCATTVSVDVAVCAGLKQQSANDNIQIFPNPTNGIFSMNVTASLSNAEIEIYSILGTKIKTQKVTIGKNEINLTDQSNGIYFINLIENNKTIHVSKIVKQ